MLSGAGSVVPAHWLAQRNPCQTPAADFTLGVLLSAHDVPHEPQARDLVFGHRSKGAEHQQGAASCLCRDGRCRVCSAHPTVQPIHSHLIPFNPIDLSIIQAPAACRCSLLLFLFAEHHLPALSFFVSFFALLRNVNSSGCPTENQGRSFSCFYFWFYSLCIPLPPPTRSPDCPAARSTLLLLRPSKSRFRFRHLSIA